MFCVCARALCEQDTEKKMVSRVGVQITLVTSRRSGKSGLGGWRANRRAPFFSAQYPIPVVEYMHVEYHNCSHSLTTGQQWLHTTNAALSVASSGVCCVRARAAVPHAVCRTTSCQVDGLWRTQSCGRPMLLLIAAD